MELACLESKTNWELFLIVIHENEICEYKELYNIYPHGI